MSRCSVEVVRVLLSAWGDAARREVFDECRGYPRRAHHEPVVLGGGLEVSDEDVEEVARALSVLSAYNPEQHGVIVKYYRGRESIEEIAGAISCGKRRVSELKGLGESFVAGQVL